MEYKIEFTVRAHKQFKKLPEDIQERISEALKVYAFEPKENQQVKKLVSSINAYRLKIGKYRAVFKKINDKLVIVVIAVGHRKDIYSWDLFK